MIKYKVSQEKLIHGKSEFPNLYRASQEDSKKKTKKILKKKNKIQ